jgi:ubiquinone/menaquinone biosynthesis C-methylase UbiE
MNFDRLAALYPWLETVCDGGLMQRCRTAFLPRTRECRRALVLGEGPGKFLTALLRQQPDLNVTCVEHCAAMIEQTRRRLQAAGLDAARVTFQQMDALDWTPPAEKFDLVVTHFFLDCFRPEQLQQLVPRLAASTTPEALWLVADFRVPERGWTRWRAQVLLALLYAFFKLTTALAASRLTPPEPLLTRAGFRLVDRRLASFGFAHADLWQKTPP